MHCLQESGWNCHGIQFQNWEDGNIKGIILQLGQADDILVIEGIHGLNDRLSYSLPTGEQVQDLYQCTDAVEY